MASAIPGFIGVYAAGYILETYQSWSYVFYTTGFTCLIGVGVYTAFGTGKQIIWFDDVLFRFFRVCFLRLFFIDFLSCYICACLLFCLYTPKMPCLVKNCEKCNSQIFAHFENNLFYMPKKIGCELI